MDFTFKLERKSGYYLLNIISPSIIIALTEFATWAIPLQSDARLQLSFTCLLSFTMFQNLVASSLPNSSTNQPLLLIYLTSMSSLILLAISMHAWLIYLYQTGTGANFNKIIFKMAGCLVHGKNREENSANALKILDKLTFIFYLLTFVVILFVSFIVIPLASTRN